MTRYTKIEVARQIGQVLVNYNQNFTRKKGYEMDATKELGKNKISVIAIDEQELRTHVLEIVRESVEQTLNGFLETGVDALCQAKHYERNS